ncbi:hypothetical protein EXN66_Car005500 [Channa argus]|uniref:Uncharacterized protein n=1 Tax=Channa argus TaxID=215402 RepID=A0A6G1PIL5_CHAAH|nr:hypothetical protein EXN66_Car005500 [Channa argus]
MNVNKFLLCLISVFFFFTKKDFVSEFNATDHSNEAVKKQGYKLIQLKLQKQAVIS